MERYRLAQGHHRAVKRLAFTSILLLVGLVAPASPASETITDALQRFLEQPAFQHASCGVSVLDADSGRVLCEWNAHRLLKPASCAKIFTAALALDVLGAKTRFATEVIPDGPISSRGILHGNLILRGGGDFSLAARFHQSHATQAVHSVAQSLHRAGLRRIEGDIVADDALFQGPPFGTGWTWDDLRYAYGAEVSALSLDDNVLDVEWAPGETTNAPIQFHPPPGASYFDWDLAPLRTVPMGTSRELQFERSPGSRHVRVRGSLPAGTAPWKDAVPIPQPALYFAHRLREALVSIGIFVSGQPRHSPGAAQSPARRMGSAPPISLLSPDVGTLVVAMMKSSQNLYAQSLLLQVGTRSPYQFPSTTTEEAGIRVLQEFIASARIPAAEVRLDDGAGLSRSSLVTPAALVAMLRFMDRHRHRQTFLESLPIAGVDGTLRRRFANTPLVGSLQGKTGTLRYVHTLAGFLTHPSGRRLVFAIMLNAYDPPRPAPTGREALDSLVLRLAHSTLPESP